MAIALDDGQWELSGHVFGAWQPVFVAGDGLDYGATDSRTQDADESQGDATDFGRDYLSGPEMSITLGLQDIQTHDVWPLLHELQSVWQDKTLRTTPGKLATLRQCRNGVTYQYLGRPRKWGISAAKHENHEFQTVETSFKLRAPEKYIEPQRSLRLELFQVSDGGLTIPAKLPWRLTRSTQARVGEVTVGGFLPAPFKVVIQGPVTGTMSGISLSGDGWEIATSTTLGAGQQMVIDTRAATITRNGTAVPGGLTAASRLNARLAVGHQFVTFNAVDPSNTGVATVTWLDTVPA